MGSIFNRVENHNKNLIRLVVLFIGNLYLNVAKSKTEFVLRSGRRREV